MNGDFTRLTFQRARHYLAVLLQQGRATLDSDWNEQIAIAGHRTETETLDVVGPCGGPLDAAGFELVAAATDLSAEDQTRPENQDPDPLAGAGDFYISGGRYYVRGRLTENERIVPFGAQPHLPAELPTESGVYIAYLDVWDRHRTALEDPAIREVALGGPDTATRVQTVWQVKLVRAGDEGDALTCLSASSAYDDATAVPTGLLRARAQPGAASDDPCIVPPGAGFRRLESQLYRFEVHGPGPRGTATFKWSRDNASVVARWESQSGPDITVSTVGRDEVLRFGPGMWVELIDDERELLGLPGTLVRIASVHERVLTLDPATADGPTDLASFGSIPRVRRWDSAGTLQPGAAWIDLEDGVQIRLSPGTYRTGDYWLIPARTATADIEWPRDGAVPRLLPPMGVRHRYCRLAVMRFDGAAWTGIDDCRHLFPPLTEMTELQYVSGDGQEALPGAPLDLPLQVGVANGEHPVAGARVRFTLAGGAGALLAGSDAEESGSATERIVLTGADGLAEVGWQLGDPATAVTAEVLAELLDVADQRVHLPVRFHARLSLASQVWYDGAGCPTLSGAATVQEAIATLAAQPRLIRYGGEGQNAGAGGVVPRPLQVVVASPCGPVAGATLTFTPEGAGIVAADAAGLPGASPGPLSVTTDATGLASVAWQLDGALAERCQQLSVALADAGPPPARAPAELLFTACAGGGGSCHPFLDDLRSDGFARRPSTAELGLEVTPRPDGTGVIDFTGGIAYVGGCRFEIEAGALELDEGVLPNEVVVDDHGAVVLLDKANPPPAFARVADVYLFGGEILRIVDRRLDMTHLDDQLQAVREHVAAKRRDRRRYIPLLAQTLPDAVHRDGRNHAVTVPTPLGMACDGDALWTASLSTSVGHVPRETATGGAAELIDVGARTYMAAYDGDTHVWFTSPQRVADGQSTISNQVLAVDRRTRAVRSVTVGRAPVAIAFDGGRMWVANVLSASISVIDVGRFQVVRTIALPPGPDGAPTTPAALAFDGEFMWVGTNGPTLFRIGANTAPEPVTIQGVGGVSALAFDGANLWFAQGAGDDDGTVGHVDVISGESRFFDLQGSALVCDGSRMWVIAGGTGASRIDPIDCATHGMVGRQQTIPGLVTGAAFDGAHLWLAINATGRTPTPERAVLVAGPPRALAALPAGGFVRRYLMG